MGVITRNDIDFINKIKDKKLYVLLNKSELVPETSRDEIINQLKNNLEDEGIIYEGISAYSSRQKKEFQFVKKSLNQFLSEENVEFNLCDEIKSEFKSIINLYYNAIKADKIGQEKLLSNVGKDIEEMYYKILKLEQPINAKKAERCLEIFKESSSKIIKQFSAIVIEYKNQLDELKNIEEEILNSLDEIFWK